ncbi:MAG: hypothetical protein OEQ39_04520 [Gammaproteobacteria bacterium]|nr:hypothetical protein [Gammaproteobacteria bacterium]
MFEVKQYIEDRKDYIGRAVTYRGMPAKIVVDETGQPSVAPLDPEYGLVPYSWASIYRYCDLYGGKF